jgi:hypothetical protein
LVNGIGMPSLRATTSVQVMHIKTMSSHPDAKATHC